MSEKCSHGISLKKDCGQCWKENGCPHPPEERDFAAVENEKCPICLSSQLAAAKAENESLKEQLQLANTDNFETEGRCFEWEQRNKRLREALKKIVVSRGFKPQQIAQAALDGGKA